jgi:hypothetical protein
MHKFSFALCVLAIAACNDGTSPTGPAQVPIAAVPATSRALVIAVDDAVDRLVSGLAPDAAAPIRAALHTLATRVHASAADPSGVREALANARQTIDQLRAPDRADAATLDALRLELDVDQ